MSESGLNPREKTGRRMRLVACTVVGAPLALALLPLYLVQVRSGHGDRWAPYSYAAAGFGMLVLPFWLVALLNLLR
ncbi:MAG: hypothetical protein EYC70_08385 [Planctomycetota bacterium]|nr:MAG: hypothetical protein EYC70_08385 [Planctomycetota bacterium]